jgi:DNA-binding NarL/FixJ family response regulator
MIDVLVAVADPIAAAGLSAILDGAEDMRCLPPVDALENVRASVAVHEPDVLVLDVVYRRLDAGLVPEIADGPTGTHVLVYVDHSAEDCGVRHMLSLGGTARLSPEALAKVDECCLTSLQHQALGCLGTGSSPDHLLRAVRTVAAGEVAAAPWLSAVTETVRGGNGGGEPAPISAREVEIMALLGQGMSNKQIAERLGIREQTVKNHVARTMDKLGAHNRLEVGLMAARHHIRVTDESES